MGTMPNTRLLLVRCDTIVGEFDSYSDIAYYLKTEVSDDGEIRMMGRKVYPEYIMKSRDPYNGWESKSDVVKNWAFSHMAKYMPREMRIYRYLV